MRKFFYFFIFLYFSQYWFTKDLEILPVYFVWLDDGVLFLMLIYVIVNLRVNWKDIFFKKWVAGFIISALISATINETLFTINTILGIRYFLQPILLFIIIYNSRFNESDLKKIINFIFFMVMVQFPLVVYQLITYNSGKPYGIYDAMFGMFSFGASNIWGIFTTLTILTLYNFYKYNQISKKALTLSLFMLFTMLILSFSKFGLLLLGIGLLINSYLKNKSKVKSFRSVIFASIAIIMLFGILRLIINLNLLEEINIDLNTLTTKIGIENIYENQLDQYGSGRFFIAGVTYEMMKTDEMFFGWGPGSYSSFGGTTLEAPRIKSWLNLFGSTSSRFDMEIVALISEYGIIGFLFFTMIYLSIIFDLKTDIDFNDHYWKSLQLSLRVILILLLISISTNNVFQTQWISNTVWILIASFYKYKKLTIR